MIFDAVLCLFKPVARQGEWWVGEDFKCSKKKEKKRSGRHRRYWISTKFHNNKIKYEKMRIKQRFEKITKKSFHPTFSLSFYVAISALSFFLSRIVKITRKYIIRIESRNMCWVFGETQFYAKKFIGMGVYIYVCIRGLKKKTDKDSISMNIRFEAKEWKNPECWIKINESEITCVRIETWKLIFH